MQKADLKQNLALHSRDIVYVPRSMISDLYEFALRINPLLQMFLYPGIYRELYTTGGGLRLDTGSPLVSENE